MSRETIGERIARLGRDRGWDQARLCKALGISYESLRKWKAGITAPNRRRVGELAQLLGVSEEVIVFGMPEPPSGGLALDQSAVGEAFIIPPLIAWEAVEMRRDLPTEFRVAMPDDSLRATTPKGTVLLCSADAEPRYGGGVLVEGADGARHIRRFAQGPAAGHWEAQATAPGYSTLSSQDGAKIIATVIGRLDGAV